jgi:hypothetical protein
MVIANPPLAEPVIDPGGVTIKPPFEMGVANFGLLLEQNRQLTVRKCSQGGVQRLERRQSLYLPLWNRKCRTILNLQRR